MELISLRDKLAKADKDISTSLEISFPEYLVGVDEKDIKCMNIYFIDNPSYILKQFDVSDVYHIKMKISNDSRIQDILLLVFINKDPNIAYGFDSFGKIYTINCDEKILDYLNNGAPIIYNEYCYTSIFKEDISNNNKIRNYIQLIETKECGTIWKTVNE